MVVMVAVMAVVVWCDTGTVHGCISVVLVVVEVVCMVHWVWWGCVGVVGSVELFSGRDVGMDRSDRGDGSCGGDGTRAHTHTHIHSTLALSRSDSH